MEVPRSRLMTFVFRSLRDVLRRRTRPAHPVIAAPIAEPQREAAPQEVVAIQEHSAPVTRDPPPLTFPSHSELHVDIDIIDKCNLKCPTCFRGTAAQKNTSAKLPLPKFREIVKKVAAEGYPNVTLINWTEPFLCKDLDQYVPLINEHGMNCWLSSNLSLRPDQYSESMIRTLAAGVDLLFVSLSGFTQEVYEINHVGGRVDWIKENLEILAKARHEWKFTTSIYVRFLEWPYNAHERELWAAEAKRLGIGFDAVPAHGDPLKPLPAADVFGKQVDAKMAAPIPPGLDEAPTKICGLIADRLAIDAKGDAYLCCAFPNEPRLRIGQYAEMTEEELLLQRLEHHFCKTCGIPARDTTDADLARIRRAVEARAALAAQEACR